MTEKKKPKSNLVYCTYVLNGEPLSRLVCDGVAYDAFSGDVAGNYVNDKRYQAVPEKGPLPLGRYYILDRESGGRIGWLKQPLKDLIARTDRSEWLSLYRDDDVIDDQTSVNNIVRGAFRIHPVGPMGVSQGCVTLTSKLAFDSLRKYIHDRNGEVLPGTEIRHYGILEVIEESVMTVQ